MHELVGMDGTLHQRLDLPARAMATAGPRGLAVLRRNDLVRCQIKLRQRGGGAYLGLRPNQNRRNEIDAGGFQGASSEGVRPGDNCGTDWIEAWVILSKSS